MKLNRKNIVRNTVAVMALLAFNHTFSQSNDKEIIEKYLSVRKLSSGNTFDIINTSENKNSQGKIINIQQTYNDIPVYGAISSVLIRDNNVKYISNSFITIPEKKSTKKASFDIQRDFSTILSSQNINGSIKDYTFVGRSDNRVLSKLVYFPTEDNQLQLSHVLNFFEKGTSNYWNIIVDATSGKVIEKTNLTLSCKFHDHSFSSEQELIPHYQKQVADDSVFKQENTINSPDNASYRVYALPVESPNFGQRTLEANPWFADASPLGWHNDGDDAYTITRGNNTYTYTDLNGSNSIGSSANGGTQRLFDFPLDLSKPVETYTDAAVTNLFYTTNKMHDIFYRFGFDEAGRNFQASNFGKGDAYTDFDPVLAEARDGASTNNANFATPPDGFSPRMQMYLWKYGYLMTYNAPTDMINRKPAAGYNIDFGGTFPTNSPITSDIVLATPLNACTDLTNTNLAGKIALIERGTCNFDFKFKKAQEKGAKAVILYNASPTQNIGNMTGSDNTVTIPGILIDNQEGLLIKSKIENGATVNVNLQYNTFSIDGSLDNGIIAHEYTHGISNRSTGNGYSCLDASKANEQMGEGWSDFFALMVTNKVDATADIPRSTGTFAANQNNNGVGIRAAKYSPNFAINNYTYGSTNGKYFDAGNGNLVVDVHGIGFIWATMLWDLHWKFADKYGFSSNIALNPNSGSAKVVQVVMEGMKLQGCNPSFVTGRDAIIAADENLNNGANKCMIWNTFAKRGLGVNAKAGATRGVLPNAISDQVEDFSVPTECSLATSDTSANLKISLYPNPANKEVFIKTDGAKILGKVKVSIFDMLGKKVNEQLIDVTANQPIITSNLPNGVYILNADGIGLNFSSKLIIKK